MPIPSYKIVELDQRFKGANHFKWAVNFDYLHNDDNSMTHSMDVLYNTERDFLKVRNWCWEVFGPSQEVDYLNVSKLPDMCHSGSWAWFRSPNRVQTVGDTMIYFENDHQLTMYKLKWT